jgi:cytidylate kinase
MGAPRRVEDMVNEQVRRWELVERSGTSGPPGACVAISHLPGSSAGELATKIADRLGYGVFGREIVEEIARDHGIQTRLVQDVDERVRSVVERFLSDGVHARAFAESDYLKSVGRVVHTLAERGGAVLLGRGAAFLLSPRQALRVLVVAPREVRVERRARARGLDAQAAARQLEWEESERRDFLRHGFGVRQQDDPTLYELVVNTGTLSLEAAADIVAEALRRTRSGRPDAQAARPGD